jgi:hypothetical protein
LTAGIMETMPKQTLGRYRQGSNMGLGLEWDRHVYFASNFIGVWHMMANIKNVAHILHLQPAT